MLYWAPIDQVAVFTSSVLQEISATTIEIWRHRKVII